MIATEVVLEALDPIEFHRPRHTLKGRLTKSDLGQVSQWRSKTLLGRPRVKGCPPEAPRGARDLVATDARELVRQVRDRVRALTRSKNVDLLSQCTETPVWVQERPFATALSELVRNAIQASGREQSVLIEACDTGEGDVLWQIQDSGKGMSGRALAHLGQQPRSVRRARAGLGVEYAWAVVEAHGGLLHFESALGVGTTATIWLPGA